ncbi:putative POL2-DNA polymerase epsilon, calytic subunit A [Tilletiaria anomala UBC 951]|uniref:DNA polymerase epsilon catalytic subunit n=1 Tax=Tilletiaria anomala (strain ATCC 24038 / CBS 436.72 / UBC 951) TaxID=1037660 RepID=A0A066VS05_TILAU|nr:putative POL2-DNA polymerase epsilon, calytic subunit A [Tilletiaria anomala UBC 951]KDN44502.1 putative POL2-DNA polymerase epsilon, calytic subunit A [Tilletiaria anomala UBC 951]
MHPTLVRADDDAGGVSRGGHAGVDFYFIQDDAVSFKVTVLYQPYFFLACRPGTETSVEEWLLRKYAGTVVRVERVWKEDLKLPNHLVNNQRLMLKLSFDKVQDLLSVRRELLPIAQEAKKKLNAFDTYADALFAADSGANGRANGAADGVGVDGVAVGYGNAARSMPLDIHFEQHEILDDRWTGGRARNGKGKAQDGKGGRGVDPQDCIIDIREYDVPYYLRVAIDNNIRVGLWYNVEFNDGKVTLSGVPSRVKRAEPCVLAFDIETTKQPLKFPDAETDVVMMISYMIDGQGFLITNRQVVSQDIDDFEYTPKDEYEGPFIIFNEPDEKALLERFFRHFQETRPRVVATYNGDSFDFPFVEARALVHGINMASEIGFSKDSEGEYKSRACAHMDCFRWVKRDSYLPQGSQGLKAVTVAKLGYDPIELDPELMTPYAIEHPQLLAQYSVSDAVATYYLYMKYVNPFIFSLCNIIPLNPDEVLRKGTGTLCETLLMVQAYDANIIFPNRHVDPVGNEYKGHVLESETYVGGHVEALEAGVFRSDIPTDFKINPESVQQLIDDLDAALAFSIVEEGKMSLNDVIDYGTVKAEIQAMLEVLRDNPLRKDPPLIYHLDVAAMYPNIMLSNRLQPDSVVTEADCATCDYNRPGMECDKRMNWAWRGEYFPAKRDEVNMIKHALTNENFPPKWPGGPRRDYWDLSPAEQNALLHKRLGDYSRKVYKKTHDTQTVVREAIICQRENPFYINTVRGFRDRRYEYKGLHKTWKKNLDKAQSSGSLTEIVDAKKMIVLYDSLQLAHKCILNSFYGYVMRKGARWYSMEMGGITCLTGATIIQMAKELVDNIGRPLELDTDGIWCMLPGVFPENFSFTCTSGKKFQISYPCTMLNYLVHEKFTNHQYHELIDKETGRYEVHSENSIFFELDGPYRAMILPSSKEEDKLLKKRYAVFEHDGSLAELKGFEVKRRGELQLIKDFQKQIFNKFLLGDTLVECYAAVAKVADQWLDVLYSKGATLDDDELIDLIAENKSMSKTLAEYGTQKSTAITTAKRLAEFLGAQMVKDKGLACKFIVSAKPHGAPVTDRAVPVAIFSAEHSVKQHYLRRFLKDNSLTDFDLRSILDWEYYIDRFGGVIQKLITIPAAMQKVPNPVPRVRHPDWLFKRVAARQDKFKQHSIKDIFQKQALLAPLPKQDAGDSTDQVPGEQAATKVNKMAVPPPLSPEEKTPDPNADYPGWLNVMRKKWRETRKTRKLEHRVAGRSALNSTMGSMFSRQSASMANAKWDVISVAPGLRPGDFKLWIAFEGRIQGLKLRVPRQFYVNFKGALQHYELPEDVTVTAISKTLPRGHIARNLIRFTVPESTFVEEEALFSSLTNNPHVDGIFEMNVPHHVRALLRLGSHCMIKPGLQSKFSRALDQGFELEDLVKAEQSSINRRKYLNQGRLFRYFYLYHGATDSRQFLTLISPDGRLTVHIVDSAGLRQLPRLENVYAISVANGKSKGRLGPGNGAFDYTDTIEVDVKVHSTEARALKAIGRELASRKGAMQSSTMLAICTSRPLSFYEAGMGSAAMDLPVITVPASRMDDELPALNWQVYSAKRMLGNYLQVSAWLAGWIDLAEEYDIPVCNLERDHALFAADIDFARALQSQDMVLWWSSTDQPDLGGSEDDSHQVQKWDEHDHMEISRPGLYSNVVLEVSLKHLALDAVLQSSSVNEMEGSGPGSMAFDASSHNLDEYSKGVAHSASALGDSILTPIVFATVKALVRMWYTKKIKAKSEHSAHLADNFWRWVSSKSSAMHEPAIQRFLHGLMRKTLLQMLAEFKRLGSDAVYANFNRIFLCTNKPTAGSAAAYGRYLMTAVGGCELFKHVALEIVNPWEYLLWMDPANFGGVICQDPFAAQPSTSFTVEMNWNIETFLPPAVQQRFASAIGGFIHNLYEAKREGAALLERTPLRAAQPVKDISTATAKWPVSRGALEESYSEKRLKHMRDTVNHRMTRRLLRNVSDIQNGVAAALAAGDPEEQGEYAFPELPGSHLRLRNPAIEFIKSVCAALSLASEVSAEVQVCKRNLLEYIGIREFSPEAHWANPCEPFRLHLVFCNFCSESRDFDLCRDPDLTLAGTRHQWRCPNCKYPYDRTAIEERLVAIAQTYVENYTLQDLRCNKCSKVRADNLAKQCNCSGSWGLTISRMQTLRRLKSLRSIAAFHSQPYLQEAIDDMLVCT